MNKLKNMKKYILLSVILLLLILIITIYYYPQNNKNTDIDHGNNIKPNTTTSKTKNIYGLSEKYTVVTYGTAEEAKRRTRNIPEARRYIVLKVRNIKTQEQMNLICLEYKWKNVCINRMKWVEDESQYEQFMDKEYRSNDKKVFDVDDDVYLELEEFREDKFEENIAKKHNDAPVRLIETRTVVN